MAIRCPDCGHEFDVTLFSFGATVECPCDIANRSAVSDPSINGRSLLPSARQLGFTLTRSRMVGAMSIVRTCCSATLWAAIPAG